MSPEVKRLVATLEHQLSLLHLSTGFIGAPSVEAQRLNAEINRLKSINQGVSHEIQ